jgi:hypothetical protein
VTARRFVAELPEGGLRAATVEDVRERLCLQFTLRWARFMLNVPEKSGIQIISNLALGKIDPSPRCAVKIEGKTTD